jgi:PAS domain-containing protein
VPFSAPSSSRARSSRQGWAARGSGLRRRALKLSAAVQWKETDDHRVIWANPPYLDLAAQVTGRSGDEVGWPLPALFGDQLVPNPAEGSLRRCSVALPDRTRPLWFEVAAMPLGDGTVYYSARPVDRLVDAEAALREFVQTLSKTFASLPIGLAVFDRRRELVMFNPALVALSMLEPGYLSQRPTLRAFLDQLRERRRMPEPRDYHSWREDIARLEEGAEKGTYHELWTLPGGESLRVTGRPHPDGAVAFMFEDISHEMSVTRRFRADLDLDRSVLDDMAAAFAVFDREGRVLRTNAAYNAMWRANGSGPATSLIEATRRWGAAFEPTGLWGDIRQFAQHETDRAAWSESVIARSGGEALCRVAPLKGGHTIVWFLSSDAGHDDPLSAWLPDRGPARTDLEPAGPVASGRGEGAA